MFVVETDRGARSVATMHATAEEAMRAVNRLRTSGWKSVRIIDETGQSVTESELAMRVMKSRIRPEC